MKLTAKGATDRHAASASSCCRPSPCKGRRGCSQELRTAPRARAYAKTALPGSFSHVALPAAHCSAHSSEQAGEGFHSRCLSRHFTTPSACPSPRTTSRACSHHRTTPGAIWRAWVDRACAVWLRGRGVGRGGVIYAACSSAEVSKQQRHHTVSAVPCCRGDGAWGQLLELGNAAVPCCRTENKEGRETAIGTQQSRPSSRGPAAALAIWPYGGGPAGPHSARFRLG
eukprot:COSAG02_NODE_1117_length_14478_cov_268.800473_5_plen_227_part_00